MKHLLFWLVPLLIFVSSCATFTEKHSRTLLMDRSTGEMEECVVDKWRNALSYEKYHACIENFEQKGYTIWSQY